MGKFMGWLCLITGIDMLIAGAVLNSELGAILIMIGIVHSVVGIVITGGKCIKRILDGPENKN